MFLARKITVSWLDLTAVTWNYFLRATANRLSILLLRFYGSFIISAAIINDWFSGNLATVIFSWDVYCLAVKGLSIVYCLSCHKPCMVSWLLSLPSEFLSLLSWNVTGLETWTTAVLLLTSLVKQLVRKTTCDPTGWALFLSVAWSLVMPVQ
jgi:hypothetical protein